MNPPADTTGDPKLIKAFPTECRGDPDCRLSQVIEGPIHFHALCEHHIFPFFGEAYIGYVANERILGISKLTRLVRLYTTALCRAGTHRLPNCRNTRKHDGSQRCGCAAARQAHVCRNAGCARDFTCHPHDSISRRIRLQSHPSSRISLYLCVHKIFYMTFLR